MVSILLTTIASRFPQPQSISDLYEKKEDETKSSGEFEDESSISNEPSTKPSLSSASSDERLDFSLLAEQLRQKLEHLEESILSTENRTERIENKTDDILLDIDTLTATLESVMTTKQDVALGSPQVPRKNPSLGFSGLKTATPNDSQRYSGEH